MGTILIGLFIFACVGLLAVNVIERSLRQLRRTFGIRKGRRRRPPTHYVIVGENERGKPIFEHRQIAERVLNRRLAPGEVVHHINGQKDNNNLWNLCVMRHADHESFHVWQRRVAAAEGRYPKRQIQLRKLRDDFDGIILSERSTATKRTRRFR